MKKEYALFTMVMLFLFAMMVVAQTLPGSNGPTGFVTRALSSQAPLVILMAFVIAGAFSYIAWRISKLD